MFMQRFQLHFGANSGSHRFALENRAVNEATFRCPDELGWKPQVCYNFTVALMYKHVNSLCHYIFLVSLHSRGRLSYHPMETSYTQDRYILTIVSKK
jgi:hypothetical protein